MTTIINNLIENIFNLDKSKNMMQKKESATNKHDNNSNNSNNSNKKNNDSSTAYTRHKYNSMTPNPSLEQGYQFKKYQSKVGTKLDSNVIYKNKKSKKSKTTAKTNENFTTNHSSLTQESQNVLNITTIDTTQKKTMEQLKEEYSKTLNEYNELASQISQTATNYVNRTSSSNPYLNKIIRFTTGQLYYVTSQGIAKYIPSLNILNSISGKNGCPANSGTYVDINLPWINDYNVEGTQVPTNPPLLIGTNMQLNESCGYEGTNVFVSNMLPNQSKPPSYIGCYQDNATTPAMTFIGGSPSSSGTSSGTTSGTYTFEQCENAAILGGYQYFALQNVNTTNGLGYCAVSNSQANSTQYGNSYVSVPLWSSNTNGKPATYAILTNDGTISVRDGNNNVYYTSPNGTNCAQVYSTTVNTDAPGNDLGYQSNQTISSCQTICDNNSSCKGFVFNTSDNKGCWPKSGTLSNTTSNTSRTIYKKTVNTSQCNYFLSLQSDGNMCIYKGIPNATNTTNIWSTNTNGKQQETNNAYVSSKGKYGTSFLKTNQILNKGDWVSSADGSLLLIMQNDGNLVLYTFKTNCSSTTTNGTTNYYGGVLANALYNIGNVGIAANMGEVAYVNSDSQLYPYPSSNVKGANTYSLIMQNTNIPGNDISGISSSNSTSVDSCMTACNNSSDCNAFVYDTSGPTPVCLPKKLSPTNIYSLNNFKVNNDMTTYIRDKTFITPLPGVSDTINNIDTLRYQNYEKPTSNTNSGSNKLSNLISAHKQQLSQLQDKLNLLSSQMNDIRNKLTNNNDLVNTQTQKDILGFDGYLLENKINNDKINGFKNNNIDNILNDTNIKTLQENYRYILWSILAIGIVIVAIKVKNNE